MRGLNNNRHFGYFFNWFYPNYFEVVNKTLNAYFDDDEVVQVVFKFLAELVLNRNNRIRFDTWNINGLIVFKESSKYVVQLLQLYDCFNKKPVKNNIYKEIFKYIKIIVEIFNNAITGNFVNFAICEFYNDQVFSVTSEMVFKAIVSQEQDLIKGYDKIYSSIFTMTSHFFKFHLETLFLKFDLALIEKILKFLIGGFSDNKFDI
mmetsp:Transcript_26050/g.18506  ORF Transcript_26050/g.18506 Transcript_26050/m.18506 type:complete len:205 (+) Transcript_26050:2552-3166(+)